jgi:hypothetical protein
MRIKKSFLILLSGFILTLGLGDTAFASSIPAMEWTDAETATSGSSLFTMGYAFKSSVDDIIVTHLGAYDSSGDGFEVPHDIGLWSNNGEALIVSATVTGESPLEGHFRYAELDESIRLVAGQTYVVGASAYGVDDPYTTGGTLVLASGITLFGIRYISSDVLKYPSNTTGGNAYFGGNFKFTSVPIPSALWLLGSGLIGIVGFRKKMEK